jgi:hypothetical protein
MGAGRGYRKRIRNFTKVALLKGCRRANPTAVVAPMPAPSSSAAVGATSSTCAAAQEATAADEVPLTVNSPEGAATLRADAVAAAVEIRSRLRGHKILLDLSAII